MQQKSDNATAKSSSLADKWRDVQGESRWEGMLDPLDLNLRNEIIRYGQFIQAIYDAFDNDAHSKYAGSSRYGKSSLFKQVQFLNAGYSISRFLYSTAQADGKSAIILRSFSDSRWSKETNWIGFVAVAEDEEKQRLGRRDIVVALRGTLRTIEWINDFHAESVQIPPVQDSINIPTYVPRPSKKTTAKALVNAKALSEKHHARCWPWLPSLFQQPFDESEEEVKVAEGWLMLYAGMDPEHPLGRTSARQQVLAELRRLLEIYKDEEVSITVVGHSLGASLAVLCAYDIADTSTNRRRPSSASSSADDLVVVPVTAISFGTPGVGNSAFARRAKELLGLRLLRVANVIDVISLYPGGLLGYEHAGVDLAIDSRLSPMLKRSLAPGDWHNLQVHLHVVAGMQGLKGGFEIVGDHDYALVNKSADCLVDKLLIPGVWWQPLNKGLAIDAQGKWRMPERRPEDIPSVDNPEFN